MATNKPIPSAISAALNTNIALQAELKRRLLTIRRSQVQNRRDAERVVASISRCWNDCPDNSLNNTTADYPNRKGRRGFFIDSDGKSTSGISCSDILCGANEMEIERQTNQVIFERKEPQSSLDKPHSSWDTTKKKNGQEVNIRIGRTMPRSGEQQNSHIAHFTFADPKNIAKEKFTKQECLFMMSMLGRLGSEETTQRDIDWYEMAVKHHTKFNRQTPWLCFCQYRSSLQNPSSRSPPWSPEEDELLIKYVAAQGSQYLLQGDPIVQLCKNLFPLRDAASVALRANATLVNPNYVDETWDADEKRKLALLMRVYSVEQRPLDLVSRTVHFPNRSAKSVAEKWVKELDPALSHRPFAPDEDEILQEDSGQWSSIDKKFPNRTRNDLKRRWTELADEHTVATHCEDRMISKVVGRRGGVSLSSQDLCVLPKTKVSRKI